MLYSMAFHGTLCHLKWRHPNFMEFHETLWYLIWRPKFHRLLLNSMEMGSFWFDDSRFPLSSRNIPWKSTEICCWLKWFHGTWWHLILRLKDSMKFHGTFHGLPWNPGIIWNCALLVPWDSMDLSDIWFWLLKNSMEYSIKVQRNLMPIKGTISKFNGIPWNSATFDLEPS